MRFTVFLLGILAMNAAAAQDRSVVVLGTATPGGGFPVYGAAFADMVEAQEPALRIEQRNTKGSTENVPLLEAGKVDIALVQGEVANAQLAKPGNGLRIVTAMYGSPGLFIVRADSPVKTIADLRGKPVALGAQGSGLTILGRTVLEAVGVEVQPITLEKAGDGPAMVLDGRAAALWGAGVGWPGFTTLSKSGARFIAPTADEIPRILAKQPLLKPMSMPAGAYPGITQPLPTVGSWSYVLARADLPEQTGYLLARALHRAEGALAARLAQASETTATNTVSAAPRPEMIHAGVQRYLRKAGILK
jgi:TRAP transporter TAXI family solute receptor